MKLSVKIFMSLVSGIAMLASCENQTENPTPTTASETLNFTKYIAVGGSTVAGFTNGGLYREGQLTSYPNLIALQTGAKFEQPLFPIGQENGTGYFVFSEANNATLLFEKIIEKTGIIGTSPLLYSKYLGTPNNFGVANLRMSDMGKSGLGNAKTQGFNPYFERILPTGKEDITYAELIKESNPTFFTASIGEYDMLDYVTSGGKSSLTETSVFALNCQKLLDALVANKAKGIITNLPNVLDFPFIKYINFDDLSRSHGVSGIYITTGNGIVRLATTSDRILLNVIPYVGKSNVSGLKKGFTMAYPLTNEEVLDKDEVNSVASRLSDFNGILKVEADKRGIVLVDLNSVYKQVLNGSDVGNGVKFSNSLTSNSLLYGSFFSLDGINPTPRGSAVIANEIIKSINENYKNLLKTAIPTLDVSKFEALKVK